MNKMERPVIVPLKDIASIQMGYSFRSRLESSTAGTVAVLQMKDLTDRNHVDRSDPVFVDMEIPAKHHLLKEGDLIFRSRGLSSTSAILDEDPGTAVVSAPLLRIRITSPNVLPEYLNWFISQPPAQAFFTSRADGTAQRIINKETLEHLEVFVPPLEKQKMIIALASLMDREQEIMKKLAAKRRQYTSAILMRLAEGE